MILLETLQAMIEEALKLGADFAFDPNDPNCSKEGLEKWKKEQIMKLE